MGKGKQAIETSVLVPSFSYVSTSTYLIAACGNYPKQNVRLFLNVKFPSLETYVTVKQLEKPTKKALEENISFYSCQLHWLTLPYIPARLQTLVLIR